MILDWSQLLPSAVQALPPLHRDIVRCFMNQPGKRRLSYKLAYETWSLNREEFDTELGYALAAIRQYLYRLGLTSAIDLESPG
jgi:hypothetical protein